MKFYNRENELANLLEIKEASKESSKMSVIIGRRRIGKTTLIKKAYPEDVYLFVSKKSEALLCEEFITVIESSLHSKVFGSFTNFKDLFEYLMNVAITQPFTLVIDEFQELLYVNKSIFSDMQNIWDSYKDRSKMNLIISGSIYSMMKKIFEDRKEPLFGRADNRIKLGPFSVATLKEIISDYHKQYTQRDLLSTYIFTGGVAKYIEIFAQKKAFTLDEQLDVIFNENSLFLDEGKNILIEEFGKEYIMYFSILSLLSSGKTSRSEMESVLGKDIGGYLDRLEKEYTIIKKVKPFLSKEGGRILKYEIIDNFFSFWFRFIYKYRSAIEIGNFEYVKEIVKRDFSMYSGKFLEKIFVEKFKESKQFSAIGNYWEKGNKNEIDIIAVNDIEKRILIAEVKINPDKITIANLKEKSKKVLIKLSGYDVEYKGLSLEDI